MKRDQDQRSNNMINSEDNVDSGVNAKEMSEDEQKNLNEEEKIKEKDNSQEESSDKESKIREEDDNYRYYCDATKGMRKSQ